MTGFFQMRIGGTFEMRKGGFFDANTQLTTTLLFLHPPRLQPIPNLITLRPSLRPTYLNHV